MVIGTDTSNATYPGQIFGGQALDVSGSSTSSDSSRYVSVPPDQAPAWLGGLAAPQTGSIATVPVPQGGGGAAAAAGTSGGSS